MSDQGYLGSLTQRTGLGAFNSQAFLIRQLLAETHVATLVQVVGCTNSGADVAVGFVDVQPLVDQIDGSGKPIPHGVLHRLPYLRMQGGANAVILDPQAGDIGIAVFAERDISRVKATQAQAAPGSNRRFDMADGLYLGGVLNGVPTQYVQFNANGINVTTPGTFSVQANAIAFNSRTLTHNGVNVGSTHVHSDAQGGMTGTPQ